MILRKVTPDDYRFLYERILKTRPVESNISHRSMPTYNEHIAFWKNTPYKKAYIIVHDGDDVGSIYLTHSNEIGVFLVPEWRGQGLGHQAIESLMDMDDNIEYFANIAPRNKRSRQLFERLGFRHIQDTFRKDIELTMDDGCGGPGGR